MIDVYLYGMTVWSTAHRLAGGYPEADTYGEIVESHQFPGGETGNSALILATLGYRTRIAGPFLGAANDAAIRGFYEPRGIDCSELETDRSFDGLTDMILIGEGSRTVFGRFGAYFSGTRRWSAPCEASIAEARMVAIDPFFGEESMRCGDLCVGHGVPYVTIDCAPDSELHRAAAATVVSNEFLSHRFPGADRAALLSEYASTSDGLTIFTSGSKEILFARRGVEAGRFTPFRVEVKSTLGAGDVFRAGVVHGLLRGLGDGGTVAFAAATSACCCKRFPMAFDPPGLAEIEAMAAVV